MEVEETTVHAILVDIAKTLQAWVIRTDSFNHQQLAKLYIALQT